MNYLTAVEGALCMTWCSGPYKELRIVNYTMGSRDRDLEKNIPKIAPL